MNAWAGLASHFGSKAAQWGAPPTRNSAAARMSIKLKHVLLLQRCVPDAAKYYSEGVGLKLKVLTETWAELDAGGAVLALKQVNGEAYRATGYSPFLAFSVTDLQGTLQRVLPMGAHMDGPIRFTPAGKVAALRNPDGHMMSLFESE